jgi:NitT/TauT family transport system permease protein
MASEKPIWHRVWGDAIAFFDRPRRFGWIDLLVVAGLFGLFFGLITLAKQVTQAQVAEVTIDLSPWALPGYTFLSLSRGLLAYVISLLFTFVYGYWAAKDRVAERVLVPMLDILQSIPVLGFFPGILLGLQAIFPGRNIGLELASVIMIFTGQAWNMTFSYYHSLRSVPQDQQEVATSYRFTWWQRFKWVETPFATIGLVWNSMMSMAGGWFFLSICEAFKLGDQDFRLPGLGSYMKEAVDQGRYDAMLWAILAMTLMIVGLDQLLWRPVNVWAQKFRVEEGGQQEEMTSWFLDWLRRSRILSGLSRLVHHWRIFWETGSRPAAKATATTAHGKRSSAILSLTAFILLLAVLAFGGFKLVGLLLDVNLEQWGEISAAAGLTLGRVLLAVALGTIWTLPAGLAIGLSPHLSRIFQPIVQVVAAFPAPMLFPIVITILAWAGVALDWGSIVLMLLGTQWYILFNIIAGSMAIPSDLREMARSYRITGWQRFRVLYFPAVFPHLVTGWVTAAGGAWNASIVAEYVTYKGEPLEAWGLGALIYKYTEERQFELLAASVVVMATVVVLFNRTVWRRLYTLAEERFSLSK